MTATVSRRAGNYGELTITMTQDGDHWTMNVAVSCPYGNEWPMVDGYDASSLWPIVNEMIDDVTRCRAGSMPAVTSWKRGDPHG
jgi:hypothetical protein